MLRYPLSAVVLCLALVSARPAQGHGIRQRIGVYEDNEGMERRRFGLDGTIQGLSSKTQIGSVSSGETSGESGLWNGPSVGSLSQASLGISMTRDQDRQRNILDDTYTREEYGSGNRVNDQWSVQANQTWDQVTETRFLAQGASDGVVDQQTVGIGIGHWFYQETIRISLDLSETLSQKPEFRILDFDSREVGDPPEGRSRGVGVAIRHLATPSTQVNYGLSQRTQNGRPETQSAQIRVLQYLVPGLPAASVDEGNREPMDYRLDEPPMSPKTSVELAFTRAFNKGPLTTETTYGEVDSLTMEAAFNLQVYQRIRTRIGYRFYKEQEVTRVLREEKRFGSDLVSVGLGYQFDAVAPRPGQARRLGYQGDIVASRYQTNGGLLGRSVEAGLSALF